jgi:hypothetical protein
MLTLHRALEGEAPQPLEYFLGRVCEEFSCLPSAAWREYLRLPAGTLETIIEMRHYARAKAAYDARGRLANDETPLEALVKSNAFALVRERRELE